MTKVFLSYARQDSVAVSALADDIRTLGHDLWMDNELSGGDVWWEQILGQIRTADVFVAAVTPTALASMPCQREMQYATDLSVPVVPVMVGAGVSQATLPPSLLQRQIIDDRVRDTEASLGLARAFNKVPARGPLPDPLPEPPPVPLSYLSGLAEQIGGEAALSAGQQSQIVVQLQRLLDDPDQAEDARTLLAQLRRRPDLSASADETTARLLSGQGDAGPGASQHPTQAGRAPWFATRWWPGLWGIAGYLGLVWLCQITTGSLSNPLTSEGIFTLAVLAGIVFGAVLIAGIAVRRLAFLVSGAGLGFTAVFMIVKDDPFMTNEAILGSMVFGVPIGLFLGAIVSIFAVPRPGHAE